MATKQSARHETRGDPKVFERLCGDTASAIDLYSQIKQAHWTVTGPNFIAVHELFDAQAALMRGHVDTMAERLRALGGVPQGTVRQAAALSDLEDLPARVLPSDEAIAAIADRYQALSETFVESASVASEADDVATEDVYVEVIRDLDKQQWFLRSHLQ